ncbi:hypothetical protein [Aquimarina rubra]|uniref:Uncharacterized protein n=1 Tax=Aquimarina rubra TaxID=1920033 RepID=A0ABW5LI38_9FLAO
MKNWPILLIFTVTYAIILVTSISNGLFSEAIWGGFIVLGITCLVIVYLFLGITLQHIMQDKNAVKLIEAILIALALFLTSVLMSSFS